MNEFTLIAHGPRTFIAKRRLGSRDPWETVCEVKGDAGDLREIHNQLFAYARNADRVQAETETAFGLLLSHSDKIPSLEGFQGFTQRKFPRNP